MGFSLHLRKNSTKRQSGSQTAKEGSPFPQSNPCPKDPGKSKLKSSVGPQCSDPNQKARQDASRKIPNRDKSVKGSSTHSDELVKYMSNLPGYLQRADRGEDIQEKALNVGVLDWSRLEKWKNRQMHVPSLYSSFAAFNSGEASSSRAATTSSRIAGGSYKLDDKKGLLSSGIKASHKEGIPESSKLSSREFESFEKTQSYTSFQKEKRNGYDKQASLAGSVASKARHYGVSLVPNENANNGRDVEAEKSLEGLQLHNLKTKERIHKPSSPRRLASLKAKNKGVSFGSQKKTSSASSEAKKMMDQFQKSDVDVDHKQCNSKPSNIVLLRPRRDQQSSSAGYFELSQLRTSYDVVSESSQSSFFTFLPEEINSEDVCSGIPHSSTLTSVTEPSSSETMQQGVDTDVDIDPSTACSDKMSSLQSEDNFFLKDVLNIKLSNHCEDNFLLKDVLNIKLSNDCEDNFLLKDVLNIKLSNDCDFSNMKESQDQETAEMTDQSGRNSSSNHRLSFSLDQMRRSFSLKERSTVPQLSSMHVSANSAPLKSESSACLDNSSKEKAKGHKRTRSTPLLRLLDPILKQKAPNIHHSDESSLTARGSMNSTSFATFNPHAEKSKGSSIQALSQLTIRNGLPLFKFVLNGERKVLAATIKSLASPEKDDEGCYFSFYLVNEIKKSRGGWMSHVSKEKSCGYVYNMVGQMKFSSSKINETSYQNYKRQCIVKEYVLFGVEVDQTDQGSSTFSRGRELAAVVIEIPCENLSHEGLHNNNLLSKGCLKCLADERCFCISGESDICGTTTAILPGGVHSAPSKGEPSTLIYRWKSGGTCDCGGWDVGCKLLVISNQKPSSDVPRDSKSCLERFQLFVQEGADQNTPLFTLAPLKDGFYSVEFSSTIDHLQAFFISVAVLSSQKLPSSLEMSNMHEEINNELSSKDKYELQGKASINYNPIPPVSPVGRV